MGARRRGRDTKVIVRFRVVRETGTCYVLEPLIAAEFTIHAGRTVLMDSRYET